MPSFSTDGVTSPLIIWEYSRAFDISFENCSSYAATISDPVFESSICKFQNHQFLHEPLSLIPAECTVMHYLKAVERIDRAPLEPEREDVDKMASILKSVKRSKVQSSSCYIVSRFIRPTSNMCEWLFIM